MSASNRVALVTGGGRGIGAAISAVLAQQGAKVAINYARDAVSANTTAELIRNAGGTAIAVPAAVENDEAVSDMIESIHSQLGPIDLLVHNAGIASRGLSVHDTDPAECLRLMEVHAFGPFRLTQRVLPDLRAAPRADLIFVSSAVAARNPPNSAPYNMAKAAMESMALTLAKEELTHGIHVNVVLPGLVTTEMGSRLVAARSGGKQVGSFENRYPFGHVCHPEEVATVVAFLASSASSYLNGQRIAVDGGIAIDVATGL